MDYHNLYKMKDDPLQMLVKISFQLFLNPLYRLCVLFCTIVLGYILFLHIHDSCKRGDLKLLLNYGPSFFVMIYGFCNLLVILLLGNQIMDLNHLVKKAAYDICNGGEEFSSKIRKEMWYFNRIAFFQLFLTFMTVVAICIDIDDPYHIFYAITYFKDHYPQHRIILTLIFHFTLLIMGLSMISTSHCICYFCLLAYIQISLMIKLLSKIEEGFNRRWDTDESLLVDRYYQNSIYERLKIFGKLLNLLKRIVSEVAAWFEMIFFIFSFLALLLVISLMLYTLYSKNPPDFTRTARTAENLERLREVLQGKIDENDNRKTDFIFLAENTTPRSHYPRLFLLCCATGLTGLLMCGTGELLKSQSEVLFMKLCFLKWFRWNIRNKQMYLIILVFALDPIKVEALGMLVLDLDLVVMVFRKAYSTAAVLATFRNSIN